MPKIGSIGIPELLIILVVVLLIFGPRRLPDMAKGLGQSVREFRRGLRDMRKEFDDESNEKDPAAPGASTSAATTEAGRPATPAATPAGSSATGVATPVDAAATGPATTDGVDAGGTSDADADRKA